MTTTRTTMTRTTMLAGIGGLAALALTRTGAAALTGSFRVHHTDAQWHAILTPEQYTVLREAGTEAPDSSPLAHETAAGTYRCAGCKTAAFDASTKFDSGTGWPSFWAPIPHAVATSTDRSLLETRTEVHCAACGSHLGHVFDDGPKPTGLRYCMNGVAMTFERRA